MPEPRKDETKEERMSRRMADPEKDSAPDAMAVLLPADKKGKQHLRIMPAEPEWLSARALGRAVGVDREADVLRGYVVAQEGPFKSDGRGEFDLQALKMIARMANAAKAGLKSRFTHPDMSSDGLGKFLGRSLNFTMGTATDQNGKQVRAVRADLHFDPSAHETPSGDLAGYVLKLAESDPDALSSSLVLQADEEYRLEKDGTPTRGEDGEDLPPLWRPTRLHASDIVDTGDAVDGLLSGGGTAAALSPELLAELTHFDHAVRLGSAALDRIFCGQNRVAVEARLRAYLDRYLARRFGGHAPAAPTPRLDALRLRLDEMALELRRQAP